MNRVWNQFPEEIGYPGQHEVNNRLFPKPTTYSLRLEIKFLDTFEQGCLLLLRILKPSWVVQNIRGRLSESLNTPS